MFTLYSKPNCPFCDQAKNLLTQLKKDFNVINVDVGQPKVEGQVYCTRDELLAAYPGTRTLPLILEDGTKIGGFTELKKHVAL